MSGKPRSAAQLLNDKRKQNARNTLKARGYDKNIVNGKSLKAALAKHRLAGKKNDEFFAALNSSSANAVALATGAAAGAAAAVANTTAKKPRSTAQAAANQRRRNAIAALRAQGLKQNQGSIKRYLNSRQGAAVASTAAVAAANNISLEEAEELVLSSPESVLVEEVVVGKSKKGTMSHSEAGKKAASSAKGADWLDQIAAAKRNLNASLAEVGSKKKATRANAMRLASTRRTSPGRARNIEMNIVLGAQGNNFNKANKTARKSANKSANKLPNNINRAIQNFANRRRAQTQRNNSYRTSNRPRPNKTNRRPYKPKME